MENKNDVVEANETGNGAGAEGNEQKRDKSEPETKAAGKRQNNSSQKGKKKQAENQPDEKAGKKQLEKKVAFSVRIDPDSAATWKAYVSSVKDMTLEKLLVAAVDEYLDTHPLSGDSKTAFNALKKVYK